MADQSREEIDAKIAVAEARTDTKFERVIGEIREGQAQQDAKFDAIMREIASTNERFTSVSSRLSEMRDDVKNDGRSTRANLLAAAAVILAGLALAIGLVEATVPAAFTAGTIYATR